MHKFTQRKVTSLTIKLFKKLLQTYLQKKCQKSCIFLHLNYNNVNTLYLHKIS